MAHDALSLHLWDKKLVTKNGDGPKISAVESDPKKEQNRELDSNLPQPVFALVTFGMYRNEGTT